MDGQASVTQRDRVPGGGDYTTGKERWGGLSAGGCAGIVKAEDGAIMATPGIRNKQRRDGGAPAGATDEPTTTGIAGQPEGTGDDARFTDYRPSWWVLPAIGGAMLLAMLVIYLGLNYEQDAVAWGGIALF